MKKLLLLVVMCFVGMMVPQQVLADAVTYTYPNLTITIDGETVTINSAKAGALEKAIKPENTEVINAIAGATDKIVFVGKFCEQDLKKLQKTDGPGQHYNCCTQKIVDMAEAKFVKKQEDQNKYVLYHDKDDLPATSENNKKYLAGGTLWQSKEVVEWVLTEERPQNERDYKKADGWSAENINTDHLNDHNVGDFVKIATAANYYRKDWDNKWVEDVQNDNAEIKNESYLQNTGNNGERIRIPQTYKFYKLVINNWNKSWTDAQEGDGTFTYETVDYANRNDVAYKYNEGDLVAFPSTYTYWKWQESKKWTSISASDVPANANVHEPKNFTEDQLDDHIGEWGDPPVYVRFITSYDVYKKESQGFTWVQEDYADGQEKDKIEYLYASVEDMTVPTQKDKRAYVGGTEYFFDGTEWTTEIPDTDEPDYTKMKFDYWKETVEEIITSKYATGALADQLCTDCTKLKTLTLNAGDFASGNTVLGNNINSLKTVNIKEDVTTLSPSMFNNISTLETVNFDDDCKIKVLPNAVFRGTGIKNLEIPSSVELIEAAAFHSCNSLETVKFVDHNPNPLIIKNQAFQNSKHIKDVYVEVNPDDRKLICEYNAFDFEGMEGQTVAESDMTTLHFLEDDFDFYAGAWKKGMAFDQEGLNGIKDGMNVTVGGQQYVKAPTQTQNDFFAQIDNNNDGYYHTENYPTTKYAPGNGWQQFAKTASPREVVFKGYVYMTYSTDKACSLPKGLIAFRVTDYVQAGTDPVSGKTINGRLVLKMIDQVPTETGMLLISTKKYVVTDETSISKIYFGDPTGTPTQYPHEETNSDKLNYMVPAVSGVKVAPVSKGPYSGNNSFALNGTSDFDHRNFIMLKDTHQFIRTQKGTMANNRAFLSLPIDKFTNDNEKAAEGPNPWNAKAGDAFNTYDTTTPDPDPDTQEAKTMMFFEYDVEEYGMIWPLIPEKELTGIATGITNVNKETVQEGIYTLQGMKVSVPNTKGIYIVNGKKVVLK